MFYMFHPADLLMIPAMVFALWAQARVKHAYTKYSKIPTRSGMTGTDVAAIILENAGVRNVSLGMVPGEMTDHYDPSRRTWAADAPSPRWASPRTRWATPSRTRRAMRP